MHIRINALKFAPLSLSDFISYVIEILVLAIVLIFLNTGEGKVTEQACYQIKYNTHLN